MTEALNNSINDISQTSNALVTCPKTGEPCPAGKVLDELYPSESIDNGILDGLSIDDGRIVATDDIKRRIKVRELRAQIALRGCSGEEDGICPVRLEMDESLARQRAVRGVRKLLNFKRK